MAPNAGSRLRVKQVKDVVQIEFIDRNILDEANIQQIGDEIGTIIDSKPTPKLLVSFANVDHLSSAALGALITVGKRVKDRGGQLRLTNIDPQIYEVFKITKLDKLFQIHDSVDSAMATFT
jgi:anti-sigma B factor antagonist